MRNEQLQKMTLSGILTGLLCLCPAVSVSIGPVPITLQTLMVAVIGVALGWRWGLGAVAAYLLLGTAGVPVFAGLNAGPGVLAGPTGGYLIGFLPGVLVIGALHQGLRPALGRLPATLLAILAGEAVIFLWGCVHLALANGLPLAAAFQAGLVPFLVPELIKIAAALFVTDYISCKIPALAAAKGRS
jgi:biotin transport system substrate-specific component